MRLAAHFPELHTDLFHAVVPFSFLFPSINFMFNSADLSFGQIKLL